MYMDDIKLFAKNEKELETLINTVRIYSQDIGMEISIEKCAMLVMKNSKWHITDEMELLNQDKIKRSEKMNLQILRNLGGLHNQTSRNETRGPFSSGPKINLRQMDQRTRKLMTMQKALHPRDDVDRLYVPRKEGGRGLSSIEDSVDTSMQRFEDYIEKDERGLITAIRNNTDDMIDNRMTKN